MPDECLAVQVVAIHKSVAIKQEYSVYLPFTHQLLARLTLLVMLNTLHTFIWCTTFPLHLGNEAIILLDKHIKTIHLCLRGIFPFLELAVYEMMVFFLGKHYYLFSPAIMLCCRRAANIRQHWTVSVREYDSSLGIACATLTLTLPSNAGQLAIQSAPCHRKCSVPGCLCPG